MQQKRLVIFVRPLDVIRIGLMIFMLLCFLYLVILSIGMLSVREVSMIVFILLNDLFSSFFFFLFFLHNILGQVVYLVSRGEINVSDSKLANTEFIRKEVVNSGCCIHGRLKLTLLRPYGCHVFLTSPTLHPGRAFSFDRPICQNQYRSAGFGYYSWLYHSWYLLLYHR